MNADAPGVPGWLAVALPIVALILLAVMLLASVAAFRALRPAGANGLAPKAAPPPAPKPGPASLAVGDGPAAWLRRLTPPPRALDSAPLIAVLGATVDDVGRLAPGAAFESTGPDGAGWKTGPPSAAGTALRLATHADGTICAFEDGLLASPHAEQRWHAALERFARLRPDRPLDGIVIVLPVALLAGASPASDEDLSARGDLLYRLLHAAQKASGWRVPVYVVLDHCEALDGFVATARLVPASSRRRPLGWAIPYALDRGFEKAWVGEGVEAVSAVLSALQPSLLMRAAEPADGELVLLFPLTFDAMAERLATLLSAMLRPSAFHQAFMFRGLYLTGQDIAASAGTEADLFASRLFHERIFPEHVLAEPAQGALTRRQRRIRVAQVALAAGVCLSVLGLHVVRSRVADGGSVLRLLRRIELLTGWSGGTAATLPTASDSQALLELMSQVSVSRLETPWAPLSFLNNIDQQVEAAIRSAFETIVLRAMRDALTLRIPYLLGVPRPAATLAMAPRLGLPCAADAAAPVDAAGLETIVGQLGTYQQQLFTYANISGDTGIGQLASLIEFSLGVNLPATFETTYQLYLNAARGAAVPSLPMPSIGASVETTLRGAVASTLDRAYPGSALALAVTDLASASAPTVDTGPAAPGAGPIAQLQAIARDLGTIRALAPTPGYAWLGGDGDAGVADPLRHVVALAQPTPGTVVAVPASLPPVLTQAAASCAASTRQSLLAARAFGTVPVLAPSDGGGTRLSPDLQAVGAALDAFLALPLVVAPAGGPDSAELAVDGPMLWNEQDLQSLQTLAESYLAFAGRSLSGPGLPDTFRLRVQASAAWRFTELARAADARAREAGAGRASGLGASSGLLREQIASFAEAAPVLGNLRGILRAGGAALPAARLDQLMADRAIALLRQVDVLLTAADPYQLADPTLSSWSGTTPLAAAAFGAATDGDVVATLPARRNYVAMLATEMAAPLVLYLQQNGGALGGTARFLVDRWSGIKTALDRYNAGTPANSLARLEQFIAVDMGQLQPGDCGKLAPAPPASDWFALQLQRIRAAVASRCHSVAYGESVAQYSDLATTFNSELAGRFPFGPPTAPDADPGDVKRFFDRFGPALPALAARLGPPAAGAQARFVADLQAVQAAFASMLTDPSPTAPLSYDVGVDFRTNAGLDPGADQVAEAVVQSGTQSLSSFAASNTFSWTEGQPVQLRFRWALNAPSVPAEGTGLLASFHATGAWALPRMIATHRPDPGTMASLSDRRPEVLEYSVKLAPNPKAAAGGETGLTAATLFLRFALTATLRMPGQPDKHQPVALPNFPTAAPQAGTFSLSPASAYGYGP